MKIIGYWHSMFEPDFPDPAWFVDSSWNQSIKDRILTHLRNGTKTPSIQLGSSWCRFRCGENLHGSREFTDGKFVWPEDLVHYIDRHNIRLPQEIVDEILSTKQFLTAELNDDDAFFSIDYDWWKQQKGWNTSAKSFKDLLDVGLLTITQIDKNKKEQQFILLKTFLFKAQDIPQKLRQIKNILAGETTTLKGRFIDYDQFKIQAINEGLHTSFDEMTYLEYQKK